MDIILYTTHCPRCKVLEAKLNQMGIKYSVCEDTDTMRNLQIKNVPMLSVNGKLLNFKDSLIYAAQGGMQNA